MTEKFRITSFGVHLKGRHFTVAKEIKEIIKLEDEMGEACDTHIRDEKCVQYLSRKTRKEETTWKTQA
jgi:hypothetical protein